MHRYFNTQTFQYITSVVVLFVVQWFTYLDPINQKNSWYSQRWDKWDSHETNDYYDWNDER